MLNQTRLAIVLKNEIRDRFSTITGFIVITYLETSKNDQKVRSVKDEV
jgi:hypothetical protein